MESFDEQVDRMRRIFRGEETYGEGTPSEQATAYRFEVMLLEIVERAVEHSDRERPAVDLLISLSGYSPATTILTYEILRPGQLFVLSSEGTADSIDVIAHHLVRPGKLAQRNFRHDTCDGTDPYNIYKLVRDEVASRRPDGRTLSAMIDITGGKKVMSAAAALVAWRLDLRLCYVESDYDPELRQPIPGTERLLILENPTTLFGEDEMASAVETFRSGAFAAAEVKFRSLANSIAEPARARLLRDLAGLYRTFSDFDLENMPNQIASVRTSLEDPLSNVSADVASQIGQQLTYLEDLGRQGDLVKFLPGFFVLGQHYQELGRLDFAALLYYRTAEGCFHERLRLQYGGFDCAAPDYDLLPVDTEKLLNDLNDVGARLGRSPLRGPPQKIGFLDAAIILYVLGDEMMSRIKIRDDRGLNHLMALAEARNRSLLAHGTQRVTSEQCRKLGGEVRAMLRVMWALHFPDGKPIDEVCESLRFLQDA